MNSIEGQDHSAKREEDARRVPNLSGLLPSLIVSFVIPLLVYIVLRPHVGGDVTPLAIGGAIPAIWIAVRLIWFRRIDVIGAISVVGFAIALLVSVFLGGNPFLLKIKEAPLVGAVGLSALVSVAIGKPALAIVLPRWGQPVPAQSRRMTVATAIIGVTLLIAAATRIVLAVILPTAIYLVVHPIVSWMILGIGLAILLKTRKGTHG